MYDIRQFKPTLYLLLLMGVTGFAMAAESPLLWVVAAGGILLNAWLVKTGRFVPMPRVVANLVTIVALVFVAMQVRGGTTPILTIGQFLVLLHLVKLYEQRANRDYAQLLVLSLLLMVAASISTASLLFGLTLITYLFVSLYCCLLFHLKVETDTAKAAFGQPEDQANPSTLRQDQRYLSRSMRRLTGLVSSVAIVLAVTTFLFFPRGAGQGLFGQIQMRPAQTLTGFSDQVSFQKIAQIQRNEEVVARVRMWRGNKPVKGTETLLLRGTALDVYSGDDAAHHGESWQWSRSPGGADDALPLDAGDTHNFPGDPGPEPVRQQISLQPTNTNVLFAVAGPVSITPSRDLKVRFSWRDAVIESGDPINGPIDYTVVSRGSLPPTDPTPAPSGMGDDRPRTSNLNPKIQQFALRPEVAGVDARGRSLAERRLNGDTSVDRQVAQNIETYLRTHFTYTLDLTGSRDLIEGRDPLVAFLYDLHKGHCEYFAGSMTAMLQSLGIPARVVVGFRCGASDYNTFAGYYIVKQSNAHAWVEALTAEGWKTFDPTSGIGDDASAEKPGLYTKLRYMFDYLEFKWASTVVAYDRGDRRNLVETLNTTMTKTAVNGSQNLWGISNRLAQWWEARRWNVSMSLLVGFIGLMLVALVVAIGWFLWERWQLRMRAKRIGLESLPASEANRLARQLGFYDDLLRLLERHQIARPPNLTPLEFSQTLSFLPSDVYDTIHRLTTIFYKIRYGTAVLNPHRQRHLTIALERVEAAMDRRNEPPFTPQPL